MKEVVGCIPDPKARIASEEMGHVRSKGAKRKCFK